MDHTTILRFASFASAFHIDDVAAAQATATNLKLRTKPSELVGPGRSNKNAPTAYAIHRNYLCDGALTSHSEAVSFRITWKRQWAGARRQPPSGGGCPRILAIREVGSNPMRFREGLAVFVSTAGANSWSANEGACGQSRLPRQRCEASVDLIPQGDKDKIQPMNDTRTRSLSYSR